MAFDKYDIIPMSMLLAGLVLIMDAANIGAAFGSTSSIQSVAITGSYFQLGAQVTGGYLVIFGPMTASIFYEVYANRHRAVGASVEPWMNGKRTIFLGKKGRSIRIPSVQKDTAGNWIPRFMTYTPLAYPWFKCPQHGLQKYVYVEHNWGIGNRYLFGDGKGTFAGMSVNLHGIDGNVVWSEHPTPVSEDFQKVCTFDLKRAGQDWFIENGDTLPEEMEVMETEYEDEEAESEGKERPQPPAPTPLVPAS